MKKKTISLILAVVMIFALAIPAFTIPAFAASTTSPYPLNQGVGPFDWQNYWTGTDFGIDVTSGEDKLIPGYELGTVGTVFWHFVNPDKLGGYANITFLDANGQEFTFNNVTSYKDNQHFGVVTLQSWKLLSAEYYPATDPGSTRFNLSHTAGQLYGTLKVTAVVNKQHDAVTKQRYYERNVQDFYSRDVQDFYSRDVWDVYSRDVQDFYSRDVQNFFERETYYTYVPVFKKEVSSNYTNTLTSRLGSNAGGKFGNGMVWLEIDVAKARNEGYTFGIAQSNPANTYIGYDYNVKIEGENLIVSFDDRFIGTQATAKVYKTSPSKQDNSGHVTLGPDGKLSVNLPTGYGSKVYLYVHFAGGISWYTTGEYKFVEWLYKDTITGEYYLARTETGEYNFVKRETGEYKFVKRETGEYDFVRTETGEYKFVKRETGEYALAKTEEVSRQTVTDEYNTAFDMVVKNAAGTPVYTATINNNGEVVIPNLIPGTYTVVLNGSDIGEKTKTVEVVAGGTAIVNFNDIPTVIGPQVDTYLDNIYSDKQLEDVKTDIKLEDVKTDNQLEDVKTDNQLADVKTDNQLPDVYLPDKILDNVYLGDETDPYNVYAIRLN